MSFLLALSLLAQERWRVHEWGTFTVLQDEAGEAVGWINTEDEPVPKFVHRLHEELLVPLDDLAPVYFQGYPACHPDVTVRLETPVLYFHPPAGARLPAAVDVRVEFRGGWLTEHFPKGDVDAPGLQEGLGRLRATTRGSLAWKGLQVGKEGPLPETDDRVWLAPRAVQAAPVVAANGEAERFLFYRGVGNLPSPLRAKREGDVLRLQGPATITKLWYVDIREDGRVAFRALKDVATPVPTAFAEGDYAAVGALRAQMKAALEVDGLHADEAEALLSTWAVSYFQAPGTRLFFLLPRAWTDEALPLQLSIAADVVRSMVGRIELVTPAQRAGLKRVATTQAVGPQWYNEWLQKDPQAWQRWNARRHEGQRVSLRAAGAKVPDDYLAFLELGRFRNALVLDELRRRPSDALKTFVEAYGLREARVDK